jgi:hypothetical protein
VIASAPAGSDAAANHPKKERIAAKYCLYICGESSFYTYTGISSYHPEGVTGYEIAELDSLRMPETFHIDFMPMLWNNNLDLIRYEIRYTRVDDRSWSSPMLLSQFKGDAQLIVDMLINPYLRMKYKYSEPPKLVAGSLILKGIKGATQVFVQVRIPAIPDFAKNAIIIGHDDRGIGAYPEDLVGKAIARAYGLAFRPAINEHGEYVESEFVIRFDVKK